MPDDSQPPKTSHAPDTVHTTDDSSFAEEQTVAHTTVGLLADPDLPGKLARYLRDILPGELGRRVDDHAEWRIEVRYDPFEAMYPDYGYLIDKGHEHVRNSNWDLVLCLTDVPLRDDEDGKILVASIEPERRVALISLPALGGVHMRRRLRRLVVPIIATLQSGNADPDADRLQSMRVRRNGRVRPAGENAVQIVRSPITGIPRLLTGMVRANRPWQLIVGLSMALAGSLAGTAFGVLYSNIWLLATSLGPYRLFSAMITAIVVFGLWIILRHGLWERPPPPPVANDPHLALRNAGTIATISVGVIAFFLMLFVLTQAAVLLIIAPDYLTTVLGRPAKWPDYPTIALMATVMGTLAGAVGSGMEDDRTVRKAAYGHREQERREMAERQRKAAEGEQS